MARETMRKEIHHFIIEELNDGLDFEVGADLIQEGLIDSLGVMKLIQFLEKRFTVEIELEEITPDNFETIDNIVIFLEERKSGTRGP